MKIALVLGSGGARGYAHVGVIDELLERGHEIVSVSGCSMGALVGGIYAAGALEEFRDFILPLRRSEVFRYADFTVSGPGLFKSDRLMDRLRSIVGDIRIEDLSIPYTAVATDLTNRREVWFHDGPLLTAIRASVAIPTAITPVVYRGRLLADGGILNPLPVDASSHFISEATVAVSLFGRNRTNLAEQAVNTGLHSEQGPAPMEKPPSDAADAALSEATDQEIRAAGDGSVSGSQASESERSDLASDTAPDAAPDTVGSLPGTLTARWRDRVTQPWRAPSSRGQGSGKPQFSAKRPWRADSDTGTDDDARAADGRPGPGWGARKTPPEWAAGFTALPKDLSTVDMMVSALEVMQTAIELPRLAVQPPDVLVSVPSDTCATFDFDRAEEVIAVGRKLAVDALDRAGL